MATSYTEYYEYETIAGDTWDGIALDFYDDEYQAKVLMGANPQYSATLIFDAGVKLIIPIIEETAADTLPPWRA